MVELDYNTKTARRKEINVTKLLEGKVAVVTGAGQGIGRAHALAMAEQGAKVVVNDLGVTYEGTGNSKTPADGVVQEIKDTGGIAVANYDNVAISEGAQNIIRTATDNFGRVDILVNNAGIAGTREPVFDISDEAWDFVMKTHLYGTFYCTRAASQIMKEQRYGRIINTSSMAGMGAGAMVAHYGAAKEGIVGFTRNVARDLAGLGITCNAIRPRAGTRFTIGDETYQVRTRSFGKEKADESRKEMQAWAPEDVSPFVVYLASEQAGNINGCVFLVLSNRIVIYDDPPRIWRIITKKEGRWLPEELVELVPKSLTRELELQLNVSQRVTPDVQAWEWADGVLSEVTPLPG